MEPEEDIETTAINRRIARKMVNDAASRGDPIAGMLEALEHVAEPYYLGLEYAEDATDLDVYP